MQLPGLATPVLVSATQMTLTTLGALDLLYAGAVTVWKRVLLLIELLSGPSVELSRFFSSLARPHHTFALAVQGPLSRPSCENPTFVTFSEGRQPSPQPAQFSGIQSPEVLEKRLADFVFKLHSYQKSWEGGANRQCPGPGDHQGLGDQDSMSQRPSASRPASRSPSDGPRITLPAVQLRDDPQQGGRQAERRPELNTRSFSQQQQQLLPSPHSRTPQSAQSSDDWRQSGPSRDLGVHSILNPSEPAGSGSSTRQASGTNTDSPQPAVGSSSHFRASPSSQHAFPSQIPAITPPTAKGYSTTFQGRRVLTPRSPRSIGIRRGSNTGTIDAQQSPFLPSRGRPYAPEPGTTPAQDVPTPPAHPQQQYGFPQVSTPSMGQRSNMPAPNRAPPSQSASPSISVSSQNPSSQTSPASYGGPKSGLPLTSGSYFPGSSIGASMQQGGGVQFPAPSGATEGPYTGAQTGSLHSSISTRQTSASDPVQVLTITTSQGYFNVPVDVHQASRLADEKRARNAGASARFRQRRKEKEKEATTNIEKLQHQTRDLERRVREVEQERDFYRAERDRFRDVIFRTPGMRDVAMQAPPSPHSTRSGPPTAQTFQPPDSSERAPRRRRTSTQGEFTGVTYNLPPASTLPPPGPGYSPPGHQGPPSLPPLRIDPASGQTTPHSTPATSTAPFDPYARPYERGWPSEGGRR